MDSYSNHFVQVFFWSSAILHSIPPMHQDIEVAKSAPNKYFFFQVLNYWHDLSRYQIVIRMSIATHVTCPHRQSTKFRYFSRFNCFMKIDSIWKFSSKTNRCKCKIKSRFFFLEKSVPTKFSITCYSMRYDAHTIRFIFDSRFEMQ